MPIWKYVRDEVLGNERVRRALIILLWTGSISLVLVTTFLAFRLNADIQRLEQLQERLEVPNPTPQKEEVPEPQTTPTQSNWHADIMRRFEQGEL